MDTLPCVSKLGEKDRLDVLLGLGFKKAFVKHETFLPRILQKMQFGWPQKLHNE